MKSKKRRQIGWIIMWLFWLICILALFLILDNVEAWLALLAFLTQSASLSIFYWLRKRASYQARWQHDLSLWFAIFAPHCLVAVLLSGIHNFPQGLALLYAIGMSVIVTAVGYRIGRLFGWWDPYTTYESELFTEAILSAIR